MPHWHTSHVPKAPPTATPHPRPSGEREQETNRSEKIITKLNEVIRYQKRTYDLRAIWQGFVKIDDVLDTPPIKDLKEQGEDLEDAEIKEPKTFEVGT